MRFLILLALASVSWAADLPKQNKIGSSASDDFDLEENDGELERDYMQRSWIVSWQVRRALRKMVAQMPCGWPEYGIPPLVPFEMNEKDIYLQRGPAETSDQLFQFRADGLNDIDMEKLNVNVMKKQIKFSFLFRNITISVDKYETNTILDVMQNLGLRIQYEGDGALEFAAKNLRISGKLKFKLPVLWGSAKVTSLKTDVSLEKFTSNISGVMNEQAAVNNFINRQIEKIVETEIQKTEEISDAIEVFLLPKVNKQLKGKDFWTLVDHIFSSNEKETDPINTTCVQ